MINRIIYALTFAACLVCAFVFKSYTLFMIAAAFPAESVILILYLAVSYPFVKCGIKARPDADRGKYTRVSLTVKTLLPTGKIRVKLRFRNSFSDELTEQLVVVHSGYNELMLSFSHCGRTEAELSHVRIYDPVSLFFIGKKMSERVSVSVLPTAVNISGLPPVGMGEIAEDGEFSKEKPGNDPSEVFGLREYRGGDKPSRIHWKLSGRQDELMVREYSLPEECRICLYADMHKCGAEQADMMLSCMMSAAVYLMEHNTVFTLAWYDAEAGGIISQEIEKEEELYYSLRALVKTSPYDGARILCADIIEKGTSVYVFTAGSGVCGGLPNVREINSISELI